MNAFSPQWYSIFLDSIAPEQTEAEVAFVARCAPLETHPRLLDLCCGSGRHANELARRGYRVVGVDTNTAALERARAAAPEGATYEALDMRTLDSLQEFDVVVNLWASFGYFDDATNEHVLRQVCTKLRPGGRVVMDLYNRDHMLRLPAEEPAVRHGVQIDTRRSWLGNRLRVQVAYSSGGADEFEWRLYTPVEFTELCQKVGLHVIHSCAWFVETLPPSADHARMQFVLERPHDN